jgi:hypothetical protein
MEFQFRHEIKVSLFCDWQDEYEEIKASPKVMIIVDVYDKDGGYWREAGRHYLPYSFTIEDAEAKRQEIISDFILNFKQNKIAEAEAKTITPTDPDDIPF